MLHLKRCLIAALSLFLAVPFYAQLSTERTPLFPDLESPKVFIKTGISADDISRLKKEDELNDKFKNNIFRIAAMANTSVGLDQFERRIQGSFVSYSLGIQSEKALALAYFFDQFNLPKEAYLYIKNVQTGTLTSAIDSRNNNVENELQTWPFEGDKHILILEVPLEQEKQVQLRLKRVSHIYRSGQGPQGAESGSCNINAICPDADPWASVRASAVIILSGGNGICTGTLVNNTLNDGKPYILTAQHCGSNVSNWAFRFNYESNDCNSNVFSGLNQTVSGAKLKASGGESDFSLLLMNNKPPLAYNAYYAGWDRSDNVPSVQACFHHPSGDIKKISINNNPAIKGNFLDGVSPPLTWKIDQWEKGTTEGGSSGSSLFDQNRRVIGQLVGGEASCTSLEASDFYGRLAISFKDRGDSSSTLRYWLDPGSSLTNILDGRNGNAGPYGLDMAITGINKLDKNVCGDSISPLISVQNLGSQSVNSFRLRILIDNQAVLDSIWTGNLSAQSSLYFQIKLKVSDGDHSLRAELTQVNNQSDEFTTNNIGNYDFKAATQGINHIVNITLDNYGSENSWAIVDSNQNTVFSGGPYSDGQQGSKIINRVCLNPGCYTFSVTDAYGDGMCCTFGNGSYQFVDMLGRVLAEGWNTPEGQPNVPITESHQICVVASSIKTYNVDAFQIFPNPTRAGFTVTWSGVGPQDLEIMDIGGKLIREIKTAEKGELYIEGLQAGTYLIRFNGATSRMIILPD